MLAAPAARSTAAARPTAASSPTAAARPTSVAFISDDLAVRQLRSAGRGATVPRGPSQAGVAFIDIVQANGAETFTLIS
jgi:hypothetical protein